jgi:1A family penicillin-binding protein
LLQVRWKTYELKRKTLLTITYHKKFPQKKDVFKTRQKKEVKGQKRHHINLQKKTSNPYTQSKRKHSFLFAVIRSISLIFIGCLVMFIFVMLFEFNQFIESLPNPRLLTTRDIPMTTKLYDRNGILLYEMYIDENRTLVPLKEIPEIVKKATVAIEDREFYTHQGFSLRGILRAAHQTLLKDNIQGGSTITQQLIKSAILTPEISLQRKIKELILAFWAEQMYTKDQILEMYLNQVPYGGTSWGIESASHTYFGKSIHEVSLAEAAFLAGLPAAPTEYSPFGKNPEKAYIRQHEVLRRMVEEHYITQEESQEAKKQTLVFASTNIPIRAPHFVLFAREYLLRNFGESQVLQGGLSITTTLDINIQDKVQQIVASEIEKLGKLQVSNGAVLVTDPRDGSILAMVGSKDYFDTEKDGNVNVTTALRQPGSSIKVVTYTAALEQGFTAASLLDDSPVSYRLAGQPAYSPVNYDGKWHGLVPLRSALGNSYNIPAVKTLDRIGVQTMIDKGRLMGIDSWDEPSRFGLSLALGGGEVTMLDMAEVYGTLANKGMRMNVSPILEIKDFNGQILQQGNQSLPFLATTPEISWIISNMLSDNTARSQAFGSNSSLVIPGKTVSVKTGTTNEKRDNWTIGYTPEVVVTVWVGNNDNSPMNPQLSSGITGAAPIWHNVMVELLKNKQDVVPEKPNSIISIPCYFGRQEYFIQGTEPRSGRCLSIPTTTPSPSPTP